MALPRFRTPGGVVFSSSVALGFLALGRAGFAVYHMDVAPRNVGIVMGKGSSEIFFCKVKFRKEDGKGEAPPVFNLDGVNYIHVKVVGMLFVATTGNNLPPSLVLELLQRVARVIKDYIGVLSEDSLRKNFVLVYELLDEVIDFGYVQSTSTEVLKPYIFNEPIVVDAGRLPSLGPAALFMQGNKRMPGTAVTKSVLAHETGGTKREEIFVDAAKEIGVLQVAKSKLEKEVEELTRQMQLEKRMRSGVHLICGIVKDVQPQKIILSDGTDISYGLLVWSIGVGLSPFVISLYSQSTWWKV
ncbi:AP-4 complex subunit mu [Forsythia ovata]|uniref:AP-4 complex subunit mu n=1 Tax=Forsythia ovata TaxID=205694 RepID=A0ABD1SLN3_9LAMI